MKVSSALPLVLLAFIASVSAWPFDIELAQSGSDYIVSYDVNLFDLTSGNDVTHILAAAVSADSTSKQIVRSVQSWSGVGDTSVTHTFPFEPSQVAIFGITAGIPSGLGGTDKDHIVLGSNVEFTFDAAGTKWSVNFPGTDMDYWPNDNVKKRMGHSLFVSIVQTYETTNSITEDDEALELFVFNELMPKAGFDANSEFSAVRFSVAVPIGKGAKKSKTNLVM